MLLGRRSQVSRQPSEQKSATAPSSSASVESATGRLSGTPQTGQALVEPLSTANDNSATAMGSSKPLISCSRALVIEAQSGRPFARCCDTKTVPPGARSQRRAAVLTADPM